MTNFTPEELSLYLYDECTPDMKSDIEKALKMDWTLREKLEVIKAAKERLDKLVTSPRPQAVDRILAYARLQTPEKV
jgi:hypothetical protein